MRPPMNCGSDRIGVDDGRTMDDSTGFDQFSRVQIHAMSWL